MNNLENNLGNAELSEDELDMVCGGATYLKTGLVAFEETVSVGKEGSLNAFEETVSVGKEMGGNGDDWFRTANFGINKAHY